jgi:hypothetical protein
MMTLSSDEWIGLLGLLVLIAALLFPRQDYRHPQDLQTSAADTDDTAPREPHVRR